MQVRECHRRSIIGKLATFAKFRYTPLRPCFLIYKIFIIVAGFTLSGCSIVSPLLRKNRPLVGTTAAASSPLFLPPLAVDKPVFSGDYGTKPIRATFSSAAAPTVSQTVPVRPAAVSYTASQIETATAVQLKYAVLLDTDVEQLPSSGLLEQIDPWMGVPYRSGGSSRSGVDCSAFTMQVLDGCCGFKLPRTSKQQHAYCEPATLESLVSGDLLFYATRGRGVSHVGIYLGNGKFAHASVSNGVMVSDLSDPYYQKRFVSAGRIPAAAPHQ
jgi:lipoprotein Spr